MPYVDLYSSVYIFVTKIFIFLHVAKTLLYCIVKFFITCLKNVDIRVQISDIKYMFILCSTIVNVRVLLSLLSLRHKGRLNDINTLYCVVFMPCSSRLKIFISGAFMWQTDCRLVKSKVIPNASQTVWEYVYLFVSNTVLFWF